MSAWQIFFLSWIPMFPLNYFLCKVSHRVGDYSAWTLSDRCLALSMSLFGPCSTVVILMLIAKDYIDKIGIDWDRKVKW